MASRPGWRKEGIILTRGKSRSNDGKTRRPIVAPASLLSEIESEVRYTRDYLGKDRLDPRVMSAMARVPRHEFVPAALCPMAYENRPLPIGQDQTISQPYIVAIMSDLAAPGVGAKVLEIGTGCGYQAAVLAEMGAEVYSVERLPELARLAADNLRRTGYGRVHCRQGDGAEGWPEAAPFEAILVTAAAWRRVPPALIAQLAPGGRLVVPVDRGASALLPDQELLLLNKDSDGNLRQKDVLRVAFVPLIESAGEKLG